MGKPFDPYIVDAVARLLPKLEDRAIPVVEWSQGLEIEYRYRAIRVLEVIEQARENLVGYERDCSV